MPGMLQQQEMFCLTQCSKLFSSDHMQTRSLQFPISPITANIICLVSDCCSVFWCHKFEPKELLLEVPRNYQ